MKILFLDVDGVLNTIRTKKIFGHQFIDNTLIGILSHIVKETDVKIVLSSSWRVLSEDFQLVEAALLNHSLKIFDCTPVLKPEPKFGYVHRCVEIQTWIDKNNIEKFAILDDDPRANIEGFFFQVDETVGLTVEIAEKVIAHLK